MGRVLFLFPLIVHSQRLASSLALALLSLTSLLSAKVPVELMPVTAPHGMVVAGHPEATQAGVEVLKAGGNAVDAAIAVSLSLGVAEPYGSGLGGKLMLLYYEAKSGKTYVVDAMDAAGASLEVGKYLKRPEADHSYGYGSAAVPGLAAGLWLAHEKWGTRAWREDVAPSIRLAQQGFEILPKTRVFFAEQEAKLRRGDPEIARLYLPGGKLPVVGTRLASPDLAATLELVAAKGRDGFYQGPVGAAIAAANEKNGGAFTLADLAAYEARLSEPIGIDFRGYRILSSPPPSNGSPLFLTMLKVLEDHEWSGPLRSAQNLDLVGRVWREVQPRVQSAIGDKPEAYFNFEKLVAPDSIAELRKKIGLSTTAGREKVAWWDDSGWSENAAAATTHFAVIDGQGNIVCATQSLSLHFGAGVVVPGTGVVLNNSMSNFAYTRPNGINYVAPGKRPRSTISPSIVFEKNKPIFAIGIPGSSRIPTAMFEALLDRLALGRPIADAIGDTRFHFERDWRKNDAESFETEESLPPSEISALQKLGWTVERSEPAGTGKHFGGINVIELNSDGSRTGYADPRRTNAAAGF